MGVLTRAAAPAQQRRVDAHFDAAASYWHDVYRHRNIDGVIYRERRALALALVDELGLPGDARILEVGCGAGGTAVALARRGFTVEAVDTVPAMLERTSRLATEAGVAARVKTSAGDVARLRFGDRAFTLVLALGVTPWLTSLPAAIHEMRRVLGPGGHLIVTADNRWRLTHLLDPWWFPPWRPLRSRGREILAWLGVVEAALRPCHHPYSVRAFDRALSAGGLEKVRGATLGFGPFTFFDRPLLAETAGVRVHHTLQALAARGVPAIRSLGSQYVVLARRPGPPGTPSWR